MAKQQKSDNIISEIEVLKKENETLRNENESLRKKLQSGKIETSIIPEGSIRIDPDNPYFEGILRDYQKKAGENSFIGNRGLLLIPGDPAAVAALISFYKRTCDMGEKVKLKKEIERFQKAAKEKS